VASIGTYPISGPGVCTGNIVPDIGFNIGIIVYPGFGKVPDEKSFLQLEIDCHSANKSSESFEKTIQLFTMINPDACCQWSEMRLQNG
jgi:hypothetical protein